MIHEAAVKGLLSPKQAWSIKRATKRINIWDGSVRSGKTVGTEYAFIRSLNAAPPGDMLMTGRTVDALKRNVINPLLSLLGNDASYHPGLREMRIFGKTIHVVGASDERSEGKIRGMTVGRIYGDELTLWPESFFQMCLSRMSLPGSQFFGTTNPDNPNHWLKKNFIDRAQYLDLARFHFKIDDNPFLDPAYVESLKREYIGLWYKRFIDGEWCVADGAIFDFFDEAVHTIDFIPDSVFYDVGIDYGTTNPCVFTVYGNNPYAKSGPKVWAEKEYYYDPKVHNRGKTDGEFSSDFVSFISPYWKKVRGVFCDPSAKSFILQLRKDGIGKFKETENEVLDGIRTVAKMLKKGDYAIYKPGCPNHIKEMYSYAWDKKAQMRGIDQPLKTNDHCMDNARYVLHSRFGTNYTYDVTRFVN